MTCMAIFVCIKGWQKYPNELLYSVQPVSVFLRWYVCATVLLSYHLYILREELSRILRETI
uniref:Uncharacterized protein n=1 Tax=Arundo donax TaxID=35708 RepID=A0A0A9C8Q7_ARUDO